MNAGGYLLRGLRSILWTGGSWDVRDQHLDVRGIRLGWLVTYLWNGGRAAPICNMVYETLTGGVGGVFF